MARNRAARPEAKPLRLFVALDPSAAAVRALDAALEPWRERFPKGRWVPAENRHITLKFLGRTWPRLVDWVHQAVREAAEQVRPFTLSFDRLGVFPGRSRARVLWIGLKDEQNSLAALAKSLDEAFADEFAPEKRGFTPHLTMARFNPPVDVRDAASDLDAFRAEAPSFRVGRLILYQSHLSPRGARYEALEEFPLRG
jgi:2'-5' RNA ligase